MGTLSLSFAVSAGFKIPIGIGHALVRAEALGGGGAWIVDGVDEVVAPRVGIGGEVVEGPFDVVGDAEGFQHFVFCLYG